MTDVEQEELKFGPDEFNEDRKAILNELAKYADGYECEMGFESTSTTPTDLGTVFRQMKEESASFSPVPEVFAISKKQLTAKGLRPKEEIQQLLEANDFYAVTFAVTLFPKMDWYFYRLDCQITLYGDGGIPIAFDIYPYDEWETLLKANLKLDVGIDEELRFSSEVPNNVPKLTGNIKARVNTGLGFVVPPRNYELQRAKIQARGRRNSEVFVRMSGAEYFQQTEPKVGIVLQVPKGCRSVRAQGLLTARRSPSILTAAVGSLFADLPTKLKSWLGLGAPLRGQTDWTII